MNHLVLLLATAALLGYTDSKVATHKLQKNWLELEKNTGNSIDSHEEPRSFMFGQSQFVHISPRPPTHLLYDQDSDGTLTCEAIGSPAPDIMWYIDGEPLHEHNPSQLSQPRFSICRARSTIRVRPRRDGARATYTCRARSGAAVDRADTHVLFLDSPEEFSERQKLFPMHPSIVYAYKMYMGKIGSDLVLPCKAKGHPRPLVEWRHKNGARIDNRENMKVLRNGSLLITSLQWADMGGYHCRATNHFGRDSITTFLYPIIDDE